MPPDSRIPVSRIDTWATAAPPLALILLTSMIVAGCAAAPPPRPEWIDRPFDEESMPGCVLVVGCGTGSTRELARKTAVDDAMQQTARSLHTIVDSEFAEIERVLDERDGADASVEVVRNTYERTSTHTNEQLRGAVIRPPLYWEEVDGGGSLCCLRLQVPIDEVFPQRKLMQAIRDSGSDQAKARRLVAVAMEYQVSDRPELAQTALTLATQISPTSPEPLRLLAKLGQREGKLDVALEHLGQLVHLVDKGEQAAITAQIVTLTAELDLRRAQARAGALDAAIEAAACGDVATATREANKYPNDEAFRKLAEEARRMAAVVAETKKREERRIDLQSAGSAAEQGDVATVEALAQKYAGDEAYTALLPPARQQAKLLVQLAEARTAASNRNFAALLRIIAEHQGDPRFAQLMSDVELGFEADFYGLKKSIEEHEEEIENLYAQRNALIEPPIIDTTLVEPLRELRRKLDSEKTELGRVRKSRELLDREFRAWQRIRNEATTANK